jgi:hypothetical protein
VFIRCDIKAPALKAIRRLPPPCYVSSEVPIFN